jgi:hypothetical protein
MRVPEKKVPGLNKFIAEFYETFNEELILAFLKLFHKI